MEQKEKIFFLKYVHLLAKFDPPSLRNLADRMTMRVFEAGATLIKEGEISDSVFFIKSGIVSVYRAVDIQKGYTF